MRTRDVIPGARRSAIAGWLTGHARQSPGAMVEAHGVESLLAAIEHEGVVSLLHSRFTEHACEWAVPDALAAPLASRTRMSAARSLLCVSEARRIQQALDKAGIPALWMKGIALGQWLYPRPYLRDIADIDLLLPDHAATLQAAEVLEPLGYTLPNPHIAGDLVVHELLAYSERARLELDLHWDLSNGALFADLLSWSTLAAEAVRVPALGECARALSPTHAFLHACMHLASNQLTWREERLRWLYDIHIMALQRDAAAWGLAVRAAKETGTADACASALRACRGTFATPLTDDVLAAFDASAAEEPVRTGRLRHWGYFQWACWQRLPTFGARLRWLRQVLFPDMAHLRVRYGADGAGMFRVSARRLVDGLRRWRGYGLRPSR